ncbi:MAG: prepilin-type N-terminal cleavage/methylation domain-containing protein [Steroidobacter sp.]
MPRRRHSAGFTLIEMIVAMVVAAIIVGFASMMVTTPIQSYLAQSRRAALSDSAETAMRALTSDIRRALPNSVRTGMNGTVRVLELIDVQYITQFRIAGTGDLMTIGSADNGFDTLNLVPVGVPTNGLRLVVGNRRDSDAANSAYRTNGASGVITPAGTNVDINAGLNHVNINPMFNFTQGSPNRRAYIIGNVTRYRCDPNTGELRRVRAQLNDNIDAGATIGPSELIASDISACSFQITDSTANHGGIVVVELMVTRNVDGNAENLRMLRQIPVENAT